MRKVPEITALFWIIKLLTTALGEVFSDYLVHQMSPVLAVGIGAIGFGISLLLQFWMRKYVPWIYWLAVVMVAIFGTMAADVLHTGLGIAYIVTSSFFALSLVGIFLIWQKFEKTLSIHSITTLRREIFYWVTVVITFALGTAVGDMSATTMHLGYLDSGILSGVLIVIPAIAYWKFGANEVICFWLAYILTRPLGASFADWLGRSTSLGGVGLGTGKVSLILFILIILFVGYLSFIQNKNNKRI